mmetsp:Transcript_39088/g.91449  ORF Transcript_39088/g.91449 Transcript_39088/m.91449 type:complete len:379 (+) Transcript_39088:531-1667(+)
MRRRHVRMHRLRNSSQLLADGAGRVRAPVALSCQLPSADEPLTQCRRNQIGEDHMGEDRAGWQRGEVRAELARKGRADKSVGPRGHLLGRMANPLAAHGHDVATCTLERRQRVEQFRGAAALAEDDEEVAGAHRAEVAVESVCTVDEERANAERLQESAQVMRACLRFAHCRQVDGGVLVPPCNLVGEIVHISFDRPERRELIRDLRGQLSKQRADVASMLRCHRSRAQSGGNSIRSRRIGGGCAWSPSDRSGSAFVSTLSKQWPPRNHPLRAARVGGVPRQPRNAYEVEQPLEARERPLGGCVTKSALRLIVHFHENAMHLQRGGHPPHPRDQLAVAARADGAAGMLLGWPLQRVREIHRNERIFRSHRDEVARIDD